MEQSSQRGDRPLDDMLKVLGDPTRLHILQVLSDADGELSFSELYDPIDLTESGTFSYHLNLLVDHFVHETEDGYELTEAGRQVVMVMHSGVVTEDPHLSPEPVALQCQFCDSQIVAGYHRERVPLYCTGCPGLVTDNGESIEVDELGYIGSMTLPPAGLRHRTRDEILRAATTWSHLDLMAWASDVCPRCSAKVNHALDICEEHDETADVCNHCDRRYRIGVKSRCTNCINSRSTYFGMYLMDTPDLIEFVAAHGLNPIADGIEWGWEFEEKLISLDPFEATFSLELDGDRLSLTVGEDLRLQAVDRT